MLPGSDGHYYGFVNIAGSSLTESGVAAGNCPFRTNDLSDPAAFRGWDGSGYTVRWRDPYLPGAGAGAGAGAGECVTVQTNNSSPFDAHVCLRRFVDGGAGGQSKLAFLGPCPSLRSVFLGVLKGSPPPGKSEYKSCLNEFNEVS